MTKINCWVLFVAGFQHPITGIEFLDHFDLLVRVRSRKISDRV